MSDAKITPHTLNFVKKLVSTFGVGLENVSNVSTMFSSAASESLARRAQATAQDPVFQKLKGQFTTGESDFVHPALEEAPLAVCPQSLTCEGIVVTAFRTTVLGELVVLFRPSAQGSQDPPQPGRRALCSAGQGVEPERRVPPRGIEAGWLQGTFCSLLPPSTWFL